MDLYWSQPNFHRDFIINELCLRRDYYILRARIDRNFFELAKAYVFIIHHLNLARRVRSILPFCVECYVLRRRCFHLRRPPRRMRRQRPRMPRLEPNDSGDSAIGE